MEVIPAIDLKNGRCVRLIQGDFEQETVFSKDPLQMASYWQDKGAERLHLVDLDGARDGKPRNLELIKDIVASLQIPVQLGGGIRSMEIIELYLETGIERVILGTAALENPDLVEMAVKRFGNEKIVVGVDAKAGKVAVKGWQETSQKDVETLIKEMKELGIKTFIYTDISRDGMLTGPDLEGLANLNKIPGIDVIASGGVSSEENLKSLSEIGISSAIVGKAFYTKDIAPDFARFKNL